MNDLKVGEWVVCIDVSGMDHSPRNRELVLPPLVLNKEYHIKDMQECTRCGEWAVDVGFRDDKIRISCMCTNTYPGFGIHWCAAKRFAPIRGMVETLREALSILKPKEQTA